MSELYLMIMAVALWCGNPINATKGATGFKSGTDLEIQAIDTCRILLKACLNNAKTTEGKQQCFNEKGHAK